MDEKGYMDIGIDLAETHPSNSKNSKQSRTEYNDTNNDDSYYSSTSSTSETIEYEKEDTGGIGAYEAILEDHRKNQKGNIFENVPIPVALKTEMETDSMQQNIEQIRKRAGYKAGLKRITNVSSIDPKISYEYYKDTSREEAENSFQQMFGTEDSNYTLGEKTNWVDCTTTKETIHGPMHSSIDNDDDINNEMSYTNISEQKGSIKNIVTHLNINKKAFEKHQMYAESLHI